MLLKSAHVSRCLENGNSLLLIKIRILAEVYGELYVLYGRMTRSEKETIDSLTIGSYILYLQYGGGDLGCPWGNALGAVANRVGSRSMCTSS